MVRSQVYSANLAALSKSANLLSGDVNEFITSEADVTFYVVSSAVGVRITIYADSDIIIDDKEILTIGTTIDTSAHLLCQFTCEPGTRLSYTLRETANVATTDVSVAVDVD